MGSCRGAVVIAASILMLPTGAYAQGELLPAGPGLIYFGGEAGWTTLNNDPASATIPGIGFRSHHQIWFDGFNVGARAGVEWGPWRTEEEVRFQHNDVRKFDTSGVTGRDDALALMTNLIYEPPLDWQVAPHVGGGIGAMHLDASMRNAGFGTVITGDDWVFAYQAIAGLRYAVTPALALEVDYRYLASETPHFRTGANFFDAGAFHPNLAISAGYHSHSLVASWTYRFGPAPRPAPPAAPAPPPLVAQKVFLVFFDWDKDTIVPEGMQIVQQAAAAFRAGALVTIQVTGYTDASASAGHNHRLSERRANNVADALTRFGVPRQTIDVSGRGKNDQRVPTADGVREPQNRRVEILFP
ncbi:MAG: OmpA family protein [Bryobacterales bacterium]|nr:OmpA family protein [Bryobacterales bacterium]